MTSNLSPIYSPTVRILSNGQLTSFLTQTGTGGIKLGDVALSRWLPDLAEDKNGYFIYLRDVDSNEVWSIGREPIHQAAALYEFGANDEGQCVWYRCTYQGIEATLEVRVSAHTNVEYRQLHLRNVTTQMRHIEVTSYVEVVLNVADAEIGHPAFSKLFVQTEFDASQQFVMAKRRPRGANEQNNWMVHGITTSDARAVVSVETDRKQFLGRGGNVAQPLAMQTAGALSGTAGNVLDPVLSLRTAVQILPESAVQLVFTLGSHTDKQGAIALTESVDKALVNLANVAKSQSANAAQLADYADNLAGAMLYRHPALRANQAVLKNSHGDARALLKQLGASTDALLLVLLDADKNDAVAQKIGAISKQLHAKGIALNCLFCVSDLHNAGHLKLSGQGHFVVAPSTFSASQWNLILAHADAVIEGELPTILALDKPVLVKPRALNLIDALQTNPPTSPRVFNQPLQCFNGHGGFSADGKEYVIRIKGDAARHQALPPLPWTNVIANEQFGFLVSETGASCTWSRNSREHRLTPWFNDPVLDPHGEAIYLRDNDSGTVWSPQPGPISQAVDCEVHHGFGYSQFLQHSHGISQQVALFVPRHDPIKIIKISLKNDTPQTRHLSVFNYQRLVLGGHMTNDARHVVTAFDEPHQALLATNKCAGVFADGVAFAGFATSDASQITSKSHTGNRYAFLGDYGSAHNPAALRLPHLNNITGAGVAPCFAQQLDIDIAPMQTVELYFLLGETTSTESALALLQRYQSAAHIEQAYAQVVAFWAEMTSAIEVKTPSPAIDLMLNGWLVYQNLCCRIWGRSAFYQSGGAYGFRDQLQDSSAMIYANPALTRQQICLHAAHQYQEGDVLHWWHPAPLEKGMRTRFADDLLWLPYITAFYISSTNDKSVLQEIRPFLTGALLEDGEDEVMQTPSVSNTAADVYEHCCLALDRSLITGAHGLPLMGTGDWNDGMNRVGRLGKGESVWMGFFLYRILTDFLPFCIERQDSLRAARYQAALTQLHSALNTDGWDGEWYRRAYYDSGAVLGSKDGDECQIDALAQAWSVISNVASDERANQALNAVERRLISDDDKLIRLLTPAFVNTPHDPGYIKGYVAGVRENGGQYTHAACWVIKAMAEAGRGARALQLLENLSPVSHAQTPQQVARYQVEPYVIAADVYGEAPHVGRGGWTWYTGSAGWMYRVAIESVLGLRLLGDKIAFTPSLAAGWTGFSVRYRLPDNKTQYVFDVKAQSLTNLPSAELDGAAIAWDGGTLALPILNDAKTHQVTIWVKPQAA